MNGRERYLRALTFDGPDRPPFRFYSLPGAFRVHGRGLEALYDRYPSDVLLSPASRGIFTFKDHPRGYGTVGAVSYDDWGCGWLALTGDYSGQPVEHPLSDWAALDSFRPPDPMIGEEGVRSMEELARKDARQHFVYVDAGELWQRMFALRGYEDLLVDLLEDRPEVYALLDMVTGWTLRRIERWLDSGLVDAVLIRDDWGTQASLMARPSIWRRVFKPAYKRIADAIHAGGAYAGFHSDGNTLDIVPDLIELGWDELNLEVHLMDMKSLALMCGNAVCLRPSLDRQHVISRGTPEDVRAHVECTFQLLASPNGGYVSWGEIGPDVPLANAEAMLETFLHLKHRPD